MCAGTLCYDKKYHWTMHTYGEGMNYIVLDLEWNQSNTGLESQIKELPFEIIEIGSVKLNKEMNFIGEFSQLIKPEVYQEMHYITKKLIHIQMAELQAGRPFPVVMREFLDWCGDDCIFCTWGPLDLVELQRNMRYYGMSPLSDKPFRFYDVQKLFSLAYEDGKTRRNLEYAIDFLKVKKDIPFHRAFSDAYYTGKVLEKIYFRDCTNESSILHNFSYDVFNIPRRKSDEIHMIFDDYEKYISREFKDKSDILLDKKVMSTKCYLCRKNNRKIIKWFTPNGKHYYCISCCDRHGYMKSKIRVRKSEDDKLYVVKTMKCITEKDVDDIISKQERAKEVRKKKRLSKKETS